MPALPFALGAGAKAATGAGAGAGLSSIKLPLLLTGLQSLIGIGSRAAQPGLSDSLLPDLNSVRSNIGASIDAGTAKRTADIKQAGAAGRLPKGSTQTALASANQRGERSKGRAFSAVEAQKLPLANLQLRKDLLERENFDEAVNFGLSGVGTAGKLLLLNKAGLI